MSLGEENELSTVLGYYTLFSSSTNTTTKLPLTKNTIPPSTNNEDDEENEQTSEENEFWSKDTWTNSQRLSAQSTLDSHKSTCDISQSSPQGPFLIKSYEENATLNWDLFYKRNKTNFFKDRHYLHKAFPKEFAFLYEEEKNEGKEFIVVEIGCGVGNTVLPLLQQSNHLASSSSSPCTKLIVYGLDFSSVAVDLLKQDERFITAANNNRAKAAVWDITSTHPSSIPSLPLLHHCANVSLLFFCLSAICPTKHSVAIHHATSTLAPNGILLFRDYGLYDEAQLKLATQRNKLLSDNVYVKSDGTRCFYFTLERVRELVEKEGLEVLELEYLTRVYRNRGEGRDRRRVWVQGRFLRKK